MRYTKEVFFYILVGLVGATTSWWCADLFGPKADGAILKYGGIAVSGFLLALKGIVKIPGLVQEIANYDRRTRETFERAALEIVLSFRKRMIVGIPLGAIAAISGILLAESNPTSAPFQQLLELIGGAVLVVSLLLLAAQLWNADRPSRFVADLKKASEIKSHSQEKLQSYLEHPPHETKTG